jgi:hypothetical protein
MEQQRWFLMHIRHDRTRKIAKENACPNFSLALSAFFRGESNDGE